MTGTMTLHPSRSARTDRRTALARSRKRHRAEVGVHRLEPRELLSGAPVPVPFEGMSRAEAEAYFFDVFLPQEQVTASWTGNVETGDAGALDPAFLNSILDRVNSYRVLAGLPGVSVSAELNADAQQAALMMAANQKISHFPDPSWTFYTPEAAESAARSNLYLGRAGPRAIDGYIDEGPPSNVDLGHRRWLLYPPLETVGIGAVPKSAAVDGPYLGSNVLDVLSEFDHSKTNGRNDLVSWPPPGHLPVSLMPQVWSFSHSGADFSTASVQVTRNGQAVPVTISSRNGRDFGDPAISWTVAGDLLPAPVEAFEVTILDVKMTGAGSSGDAFQSFSYETTAFDPFLSVPNPEAIEGTFAGTYAITAAEVVVDGRHPFVEIEIVRQGSLSASMPGLTLMVRNDGLGHFADPAHPGSPRTSPFFYPVQFREGQNRARARLPFLDPGGDWGTDSLVIDLHPGTFYPQSFGGAASTAKPLSTVVVTRAESSRIPVPGPIASPPQDRAPGDFDGDEITDSVTFTIDERGLGWFDVTTSSDGITRSLSLGQAGDLPIVGDYDGDGVPDVGVYRVDVATGSGRFLIRQSSDRRVVERAFGGAGDLPIVGDFDGDGMADLAVYGYSPLNGFSRFAILPSGGGPAMTQGFGGFLDMAIAADFDGDGATDIAVYGFSPLEGFSRFAILPSSGGAASSIPFGGFDDRPILGDFDGDGIDDIAVYGYSPDEGFSRFAVLSSAGRAPRSIPFGGFDDRPVSGDFDGDGVTDLAVFGYSPLNGFSRFGILPSSGQAARTVPSGSASTIGLPTAPGIVRERVLAMNSGPGIGSAAAAHSAGSARGRLVSLASIDDSGQGGAGDGRINAVRRVDPWEPSLVDEALDELG